MDPFEAWSGEAATRVRELKPRPTKNCPIKIRSGHPELGVEGNPETGCPQDPGPGLGGNLSVGPFQAKASPILHENSRFVTGVTLAHIVNSLTLTWGFSLGKTKGSTC